MLIKAKDMRKLIKAKNQEEAKIKCLAEQNQMANPKVIKYWLDKIKKKSECYFQSYSNYNEAEVEFMDLEIRHNFKAYQKAFAKLGYKLFPINDAYGCGWAITF